MSAIEALRMARENGVHLSIAGADLILDADREPAPPLLETIRRHKVGIVALLTEPENEWTAEDWQAFFDERAGIAEFDDGQNRADAEARAFECCVIEWLNRNPAPSEPGRCAWCGNADSTGCQVVPFATNEHGHTWLHSRCWSPWHERRIQRAAEALWKFGIATNQHSEV